MTQAEYQARIELTNAACEDFCSRFGLRQPSDDGLIKVRAEKKCRAIIEWLGLAPADDELATGKIFTVERDQCTIVAFISVPAKGLRTFDISTQQGGLIGVMKITGTEREQYGFRSSGLLDDWVRRKVYQHHKTAEDIEREERFKRLHEEGLARRAEWEKKNNELCEAEYTALKEQVKHSALPDAVVDQLVSL